MNILILTCNQFSSESLFWCFSHLEYYDDILILKSPKVLRSITSDLRFPVDVNDIISNDSSKLVRTVKFDKKNKPIIVSEDKDLLKSKKNKSKINKNKHRNDTHDVNKIVNSEDDLFSRSVSKSRKLLFKSKKSKIRNSSVNTFLNMKSRNKRSY